MAPTSRPESRRAAGLYLTLAADGAAAAPEQRSLTRRLALLVAALMLAFAAPLGWASAAGAVSGPGDTQAVLVKSSSGGDEDEDDSGSGGGDGDTDEASDTQGETTTGRDEQTGAETQMTNTDVTGASTGISTRGESDPGDATGKTENDDSGTRGQTRTGRDAQTGEETEAKNTDRPGLDTGKSTRGETDPGDKTGKSERR